MWLSTIFRRRTSKAGAEGQRGRGAEGRGRTPLDERLLRRLERLALSASRSLAGGMSGVHPSRRRLPAPTFTDYRPYTSGDDPRYVDWNAYARLDHLQIKLGETEQDVRVYVLVDCSASMDWGEGDTNKLHSARLLAAALGYVALASGDRLEVIPMGGTEGQRGRRAEGLGRHATWGPASGRQRGASLLQYLQRLEAGGASSLGSVLAQLARERRPGLLVIASDFWHTAGGKGAEGQRGRGAAEDAARRAPAPASGATGPVRIAQSGGRHERRAS